MAVPILRFFVLSFVLGAVILCTFTHFTETSESRYSPYLRRNLLQESVGGDEHFLGVATLPTSPGSSPNNHVFHQDQVDSNRTPAITQPLIPATVQNSSDFSSFPDFLQTQVKEDSNITSEGQPGLQVPSQTDPLSSSNADSSGNPSPDNPLLSGDIETHHEALEEKEAKQASEKSMKAVERAEETIASSRNQGLALEASVMQLMGKLEAATAAAVAAASTTGADGDHAEKTRPTQNSTGDPGQGPFSGGAAYSISGGTTNDSILSQPARPRSAPSVAPTVDQELSQQHDDSKYRTRRHRHHSGRLVSFTGDLSNVSLRSYWSKRSRHSRSPRDPPSLPGHQPNRSLPHPAPISNDTTPSSATSEVDSSAALSQAAKASAAMTTVLLGHAIGAELRNITAAISNLQSALNRTRAQLHEAKSVAADAHEEMSILSLERESAKLIEKIERSEYSIDYATGSLRDENGNDVELPPELLDRLDQNLEPPAQLVVKEPDQTPQSVPELENPQPSTGVVQQLDLFSVSPTPSPIVSSLNPPKEYEGALEHEEPQNPSPPSSESAVHDEETLSFPELHNSPTSAEPTLPVQGSQVSELRYSHGRSPGIDFLDSSASANVKVDPTRHNAGEHDSSSAHGEQRIWDAGRSESPEDSASTEKGLDAPLGNTPGATVEDRSHEKYTDGSRPEFTTRRSSRKENAQPVESSHAELGQTRSTNPNHFLHATAKHFPYVSPSTDVLSIATALSKPVHNESKEVADAKERADRLDALVKRLRLAREAADPASLKSDFVMLQDLAIVLVAASLGGMLAAFLFGAANTGIGYVFGGFMVGPSSPILTFGIFHIDSRYQSTLQRVDAVHTVAMLGPIFELFRIGIMYAALRRQRKLANTNARPRCGTSRGSCEQSKIFALSVDHKPIRHDDVERPPSLRSPQSRKPQQQQQQQQHQQQHDARETLERRHSHKSETIETGVIEPGDDLAGSNKSYGNVRSICMGFAKSNRQLWCEWLAYFFAVFSIAAYLSSAVGWTQTLTEALLFAAAVTLSGTSRVLAALDSARARHLPSGSAIVDLLTMQDLLLAPILAVPTALHNALLPSGGSTEAWTKTLAVYLVCIATAVLLSRVAVPFVLGRILKSYVASAYSTQDQQVETPSPVAPTTPPGQLEKPAQSKAPKNCENVQSTPSVPTHHELVAPEPAGPRPTYKRSPKHGESRVVLTPKSGGEGRASTAAPSELLTIIVVGYALGMSLLSEQMSLSYGFGALIAGLFWHSNIASSSEHMLDDTSKDSIGVSASQLHDRLRNEQIQATEAVAATLASLFGSVYLASLGMIVSPVFMWQNLGTISCFVGTTFILKMVVAALTMRFSCGTPWAEALAAGSTLGHVSTVALFFVGRAQSLGLFSRQLHLLTLSSAFIHMALRPAPPFLLRRALGGAGDCNNGIASFAGNCVRFVPFSATCRSCCEPVLTGCTSGTCPHCAYARQKGADETL